ncbi:MAG: hypothetical protein WCH74_10620 [Chloroflexota bacterium]
MSSPVSPGVSGSSTAPLSSPAPTTQEISAPGIKGTLTIGVARPVVSAPSDPGSDSIIATDSTDPALAGFSIQVPRGAYLDAHPFAVTAAPITASTFGSLVKPISDLFIVEAGDLEAATPMAVRIPAIVPKGASVGAFYYDGASGSLEGIPVVAQDATGATLLTRHFSSIFLSIAEAGLPDSIGSGFVPSSDAWQMENLSSYITPGMCSGMSTTAMWYFLTQQRALGASHLYGTYDNNGGTPTPGFFADDASAIRLASTVQARTDWNSLGARFFWNQEWIAGSLAYDAFRYTMAVTGEPQLIFVGAANGDWHAMVVYEVDSGHLWVSDPNFPGEARSITYDRSTGTFSPYVGGETFVKFLYAAKSAIVPWRDLATAWEAFTDGTIGNDLFPEVDFQVADNAAGTGHEALASGVETDQPRIWVSAATFNPTTTVEVFSGTKSIGNAGYGWMIGVPLKVGDNVIGIQVNASPTLAIGSTWVQFKRFTITRLSPSPSPSPVGGVWNLVSGPDQIGETSPLSKISWSLEGEAGSLVANVSDSKADFNTRLNWSEPGTLAPGDPLDIGATVARIKMPDDCENNYTSVCDLASEIDAGLLVTTPPDSPQQGPAPITSLTARGFGWQATSLPIVPEYDPAYGPTMVLQVGAIVADGQRWYQYVYEWSGTR